MNTLFQHLQRNYIYLKQLNDEYLCMLLIKFSGQNVPTSLSLRIKCLRRYQHWSMRPTAHEKKKEGMTNRSELESVIWMSAMIKLARNEHPLTLSVHRARDQQDSKEKTGKTVHSDGRDQTDFDNWQPGSWKGEREINATAIKGVFYASWPKLVIDNVLDAVEQKIVITKATSRLEKMNANCERNLKCWYMPQHDKIISKVCSHSKCFE